jgi:hypothetical protein
VGEDQTEREVAKALAAARDDGIAHFIYGLCHPATGELRYVGFTKRLKHRYRCHRFGSKKPRTHRDRWIRALRATGLEPEMLIIEGVSGRAAAVDAEREMIAYFKMLGCRLTNATDGGEGALGHRWSDEERQRMSRERGGSNHPNFGKCRPASTREKIAAKLRGRKSAPEVNAKRAATMRAKPPRGDGYRQKLSDVQPKKTYTFLSPLGERVTFTGLAKFCRERGLNAGAMCWVASGKYASHKGWRRAQ